MSCSLNESPITYIMSITVHALHEIAAIFVAAGLGIFYAAWLA